MLSDVYSSLATKYSIYYGYQTHFTPIPHPTPQKKMLNSFFFRKIFLDATFSTMSHNLYARYKDG